MRRRLLATTAMCGLVFFAATPAFAACTGSGTITCSGSDTTGVNAAGAPANVTVNAGASVHPSVGGADAISIGSGSVTVGTGATIISDAAVGIHVTNNAGATPMTVSLNGGSVSGGTFGILVESGGDITIASGSSVSGGTAIKTGNLNSVTASVVRISNGATITGNVVGSANANDEFHWIQDTSGTFATGDVGVAAKYRSFEKFYKDGTATTTLTGTNALNWNVTAGTLSADAVTQASTVDIASGATFEFNTASGTYAGNVSGAGTFTIIDGSIITLTGDNSSHTGQLNIDLNNNVTVGSQNALGAGNVFINQSTLTFSAGFTAANNIAIGANDATLALGANNVTFSGVLSGAAGHDIGKTGSGTLNLTNAGNTYAGLLNITAGTVAGTTAAALGDGNINIGGGAILRVNGGGGTLNNNLSGTGTFLNDGGNLTLTGNNASFTGAMTVQNSSTVTLSAANTISGISGMSIDQSTLAFGSSFSTDRLFSIGAGDATFDTGANNVTISNAISGGANHDLIKAGTGTLTLGGTNTYGNTIINAGKLVVNGSTASAAVTTVNNGGTLGGTGTVRQTTVNSGGTIAPGNSIGTLNAGGIVQFNGGSIYAVEYDNTNADKLIGAGDIVINSGATLNLIGTTGIAYNNTTGPYTILQTTGGLRFGQFGTVTNNLAFLDPVVTYNSQNVQVSFTRNTTGFISMAENDTQTGTATALGNLPGSNDVFLAFTGVTTAQAAGALESLSGAGVVGIVPNTTPSFMQPIMAHIGGDAGASIALQTAANNADPSVWTSAYMEPRGALTRNFDTWFQVIGGTGKSDADSQSPKQKRGNYGAVGGIDRAFDDDGRYGIYAGYLRSDFSSDAIGASSRVNSYQVGGFVQRPATGDFTYTIGASAMYHDIDTVRHVVVGASDFSPHGDTNGNTLLAFGQLSHPLYVPAFGNLGLEGFGTVQVTRNHTDGYSETGGGAANLVVDGVTKTNPATTIGIRGGKHIGPVLATASLGWQHTFGDTDNDATMRFQGSTTQFTSTGTPIADDAAVVNLKASADMRNGISGFAGYDGTLARDAQDHAFKAGVKIGF